MATATNTIFPWRDTYSVGIPQIDSQHKGLIRLINDLQTAMMEGKGKQALSSIINDLIRYTESHFAFEEALLQQSLLKCEVALGVADQIVDDRRQGLFALAFHHCSL